MDAATPLAELRLAQIAVPLNWWGRPTVVLPDAVAERLAMAGPADGKHYGHSRLEVRRFDADTYETRAVHAILQAVIGLYPEEWGVAEYERFGTGHFCGWIVGESGWSMVARTLKNCAATQHLNVDPVHLHPDGRSHFGW
ncbi:hypothetical protein [Streptomyces sp. NPDC020965]|uniref:hypothetical protein n=1 Tax=Streptomyces sp. NPDC020965 TaxID=3365105 RepID=UPI0037B1EEE7